MRTHFRAWPALVLVMLSCLTSQTAHAAIVVVGTCKNLVHFSTIQSAVNAVPANSTIDICPGVYAEQISINKSLTLTGVSNGTADGVVVVSPSAGLAANATSLSSGDPLTAHLWVLGPATVSLNNLTVDSLGNGITGCAPVLIGILYQNASGTINHIVTRNQWIGASESDPNLNGCQTGLGVFVQSGNSGTSTVTVENSSVHDYQKNGITGNETGTTITVSNNDVVGQGSTDGAAENGVQIAFGAAGGVNANFITDDVWAPDTITDPGDAAAGILIYDTTGFLSVKNNTVGNTQYGITVDTDTGDSGDASITGNKVFGTRIFDGIDVCSNGNAVTSNTVTNSAESAIHMDASCGSTGNSNNVSSNIMIDACVGILEDAGTTNTIGTNTFFAAGATSGSSCTAVPSRQTGSMKGGIQGSAVSHRHFVPSRP